MIKKIKDAVLSKIKAFGAFASANDEFTHYVIYPLVMIIFGLTLTFTGEFVAGTVWIVGYFIYSRINVLASRGY